MHIYDNLPIGTVLTIKRPGEYSGYDFIIKYYSTWYYLKQFNIHRGHYIGTLSNVQVDPVKLSSLDHSVIGLEKKGIHKGSLLYSKLDVDVLPIDTILWPHDDESDRWIKNNDGSLSRLESTEKFETKYFIDWFAKGIFWQVPREIEHMIPN